MRRAAVLVLLLVVPALAGCINAPDLTLSLASDDLVAGIQDPGGHVAGEEVVLEASPVVEGATYSWSFAHATAEGPVLRWLPLEPGSYEVVLTVTRGDEVVQRSHVVEVLPEDADADADEDGTDGDDADAGDGGADGDADDAQPDPCGFTTEAIAAVGRANVYTVSFPWTCQPDSWEWDLGDGTRSRESSVRHEYRRDGVHTVTLALVHDGETRTHTATVTVRDVPLRIVPTVDGSDVTFALEWGRDVVSASWDLGNGDTSDDLTPSTHYDAAGPAPDTAWTVTATATDAAGKTATVEHALFLDAYPLVIIPDVQEDTVSLSTHWGWPVATARWSLGPDSDCAFVDGTGAEDEEPTVRCDRPGSHLVRVEVSGQGRTAVATGHAVVEEVPLRIGVVVDKDEATLTPVWYDDLSGFQWSLGDGHTSTDEVVTHGYRDYRTFTARLTATGGGKTLTAEAPVTITEIPLRVDGSLGEGNVWTGALDWAPSTTVSWDFGDAEAAKDGHAHADAADERTVQHVYAYKGTYTVKVTASDGTHTESWEGEVEVPVGIEPAWGDPATKRLRPGVQTSADGAQCTAAFLLHQEWSRYFIATAAHCVGTSGGAGGRQFSPDCKQNKALPLGAEVTFRDWGATEQPDGAEDVVGTLAYSSWGAMVDAGVTDPAACTGNDFALVEVDRADLDKVHPAVLHFGGPVSFGAQGAREVGSGVRAYGASSSRDAATLVDPSLSNAKGGQYLAHDGWGHTVRLDNPAIPGDSGGPLLTATGDALGVLSVISSDGTNTYTDLAKAVAWMEANTEFDVDLVRWTDWDPSLPVPSSDDPFSCPVAALCEPEDPQDPGGGVGPEELPALPDLSFLECDDTELLPWVECVVFTLLGGGSGEEEGGG